MAGMSRRELVVGLPGLLALAANGQAADGQAADGQEADGQEAGEAVLSASRVFPYGDLAVKKNANGSETRAVVRGALATGEAVEVHETTLAVGGVPNPPHAHRASDFILVREGTIAFEHDGKAERVGAGGVILAASGTMHTIRNVGDGPARYFVVGVGREK